MEPTQKAVANPEVAMGTGRGQVSPQEIKHEEDVVHPPQSVGREFVRQYYTMLHQAPEQLHRFYSQNSSFLHERWEGPKIEEKPAIGQIEIYERIKTMNFRDCHAKIFQVDSQLSVCHTVVVQVLGELSNNGESLRKFMQTFILVPQTNKKYYVHNDIFRYQEDDPISEHPECNNGVREGEMNPALQAVAGPNEALYVQQLEDGVMAAEVMTGEKDESIGMEPKMEEDDTKESEQEVMEVEDSSPVELKQEEPEGEEDQVEIDDKSAVVTVDSEVRESSAPPMKFSSWAEMASRNRGSFKPIPHKVELRNGIVPPALPQANNIHVTPTLPTAKSPPPLSQQQQTPQQQAQKPINQREQQQQHHLLGSGDDSNNNTPSTRGMQFYPDQQQIFVGNLPHHMSDQDLKEFFEKYGKVLDIRINRKPNNSLPNFGFIAFDNPDTVKHILSLRPLYYNGRFRVNVEEKKRREDLISCRPRSGNVLVSNNNQSPDCNVANGNFIHKEENPRAVSQGDC